MYSKKIKNTFKSIALFTAMGMALVACSDDNPTPPAPKVETNYAILSGNPGQIGLLSAYTSMPSGTIDNAKENTLNTQTNGMKFFGKYVFQRVKLGKAPSSDDGIRRYEIGDKGQLIESGTISAGPGSNFHVVNENLGFYLDSNKGLLKLQTFNPSTMQRTGDIDLSVVKNDTFKFNAVGMYFIASKENKLYVSVNHGTEKGKGSFFFEKPLGYAELAVIDIPTKKYEKTIKSDKVSYIGYPSNANQMFTIGDDGALYMCYHGFTSFAGATGSSIIRIKKGATDFDKDWVIKADDYTKGTTFGTVAVKDGKLYTQVGTEAIVFGAKGNMLTKAIYDYYEFDTTTKQGKKVEGLPKTKYVFFNAQGIVNFDGTLYFNVANDSYNGYYKMTSSGVEKAFNVTKGGRVFGFAKLVN